MCVQAGGVVQVVWGRGWQVNGGSVCGVGGRGKGVVWEGEGVLVNLD